MNPKYQKVCAEIAKTEKKIEDLQAQLKELYDRKTEMENLEIINTVRAMVNLCKLLAVKVKCQLETIYTGISGELSLVVALPIFDALISGIYIEAGGLQVLFCIPGTDSYILQFRYALRGISHCPVIVFSDRLYGH